MTLRLIYDEHAFQQAISHGRQQKKQQEPLHLAISIGGSLPAEKIKQVKADIHKWIAAELDAFGQDPTHFMFSSASSPHPEPAPVVHISLESLAIPKEELRLLNGHLEHKVREALAQTYPAIPFTSVCGRDIPGSQVDLLNILTTVTSVPPINGKWVMAWFAPDDVFRIEISATRLATTDQAVVGLANTCPSCQLKEIDIFSNCQGSIGTVIQHGCNATPNFGLLAYEGGRGASTILFIKLVFHYYPDPNTFWEIFGGRTIIFTWVDDHASTPQPPLPGTITVRKSNGRLPFTPNELWAIGTPYGSRGTFFADVDGDGKADAIFVNDDTVTVRRSIVSSTGQGSFGPPEDWTGGPYFGNFGTFFADVDGDGRADAIVINLV